MALDRIDHLAFITPDLTGTIRFYRDLLGMDLSLGIGHDGFRHYFFSAGDNYIAFFAYDGASAMTKKFHGNRTSDPIGFDHVAFTVETREEFFEWKDRLQAAGIEVTGPIDHGVFWSLYFFDNNNIPLEIAWNLMEVAEAPAVVDDDIPAIVHEGSGPQPGHWPEIGGHEAREGRQRLCPAQGTAGQRTRQAHGGGPGCPRTGRRGLKAVVPVQNWRSNRMM